MNSLFTFEPAMAIPLGLVSALFFMPVLAGVLSALSERRAQALEDAKGPWVGEVWLEWSICRGSTMFRARFASKQAAEAAVKSRAAVLDDILPRTYRAEYSCGRPYAEKYDFGIYFGVRELTEDEKVNGVSRIWTTEMPGHRGHAGEHSSAHPLANLHSVGEVSQLPGELAGYRI